jgi:flagellar hook-associated protein 3
MNISPVPSTRVSDQYVSQRLVSQLQSDQQALSDLQEQISTGNQLLYPSDNPSDAMQGMAVESLIEQKTQAATNLTGTQAVLNSTESTLGQINTLLTTVRSTAMSAIGTSATAGTTQNAIDSINSSLQQLIALANQQFGGQYLFSGSKVTTVPFVSTPNGVLYQGNQQTMQTYSDINTLMGTNVPGSQAFGAVSNPLGASADLNPVLTQNTPLSQLNGGQGIPTGSIIISDGTHSSTIDLSSANTIGDVAQLIEQNPPAGRTVTARVTSTGLDIQLNSAGGGNLSVREVGDGHVAASLGILDTSSSGTGPLVGGDLNPALTVTTPLSNLLGTRASAVLTEPGPANDIVFQANSNGAQYNGATINLVNSANLQSGPGITDGTATATYSANGVAAQAALTLPGADNDLILTANQSGTAFNDVSVNIVNGGSMGDTAQAAYDPSTKTLTLTVDGSNQTSTDALISAINTEGTFTAARDSSAEPNSSGGVVLSASAGMNKANTYNTGGDPNTLFVYVQNGATTANQVIAAVNAQGTFTASLDPAELKNNGAGTVFSSDALGGAPLQAAGGGGVNLDQTSGLQITNGGQTYQINISGDKTVEDLLNTLNNSNAGLQAQINSAGTGIEVRSVLSGSQLTVGENGGSTATELGIRSFELSTPLASLNSGQGVNVTGSPAFVIQRADGVSLPIDLTGAETVGDVINAINNNSTNLASGVPVVASLATNGNGIQLTDDDPSGTQTLTVSGGTTSAQVAQQLGLIPTSATTNSAPSPATQPSASIAFPGSNNDLVFTATAEGTQFNGASVAFENTGAGPSVSYDASTKTLTLDVDPSTTTASDIVNLVASDPTASQYFTASLGTTDAGNDGSGTLGTLPANATLSGGTPQTLVGSDTNPIEVQGAFTALSQLVSALQAGNTAGVEAAVNLLDQSTTLVNTAEAEVGVQLQNINALQTQNQSDQVQLQTVKSSELDVDMTQAITSLLAIQTSFQASLQAAGAISKLTLLNYI